MTTEPLTPDAVRALIAEAEGAAGMQKALFPAGRDLIGRLAAALSATLPREDADLYAQATAWAEGDGLSLLSEYGHVSGDDEGGYQLAFMGDPRDLLRGAYLRLASRTVETAEERTVLGVLPVHEDGSTDWPAFAQQILEASPVPPTPEEPDSARECGNDSHHGYNTGYCSDCTKEARDAP